MTAISKNMVMFADGSAYIPSLCEELASGIGRVSDIFAVVHSWKVKGALPKGLSAAVAKSILLAGMIDNLRKRKGWEARDYATRYAEAVRILSLKGWTKNAPATDQYRTQADQQVYQAAVSMRSYYWVKYDLEPNATTGRKRATKEEKAKKEAAKSDAQKLDALSAKAADKEIKEAVKAQDAELIKQQTPAAFTLVAPVKNVRDVVSYMLNVRDGFIATRAKNPDWFKEDVIDDVFRNVVKELNRVEAKYKK